MGPDEAEEDVEDHQAQKQTAGHLWAQRSSHGCAVWDEPSCPVGKPLTVAHDDDEEGPLAAEW